MGRSYTDRTTAGWLEILQLWVNLPSSLKMTEPGYTGLQEVDIPAIPFAGAKASIRLVSGEFSGTQGPITSLTDVFMSVVRLDAGASDLLPAPRHRNVFFYIVEGSGSVSNVSYRKWQLIEFTSDADMIEIRAEQPTVLVFGHADPILEPVVAHGPFVMNRPEEIVEAYRDYEAGKFDRVTPLRQVGH